LLADVGFDGTRVTDAGLSHLANAELQMLSVADTAVTDKGIMQLGAAKKMRRLDLSGTAVTDASIKFITETYPELHEIRIQNVADITDDGIIELHKNEKLIWLYVSNNQFGNATLIKLQVLLTNLRVETR